MTKIGSSREGVPDEAGCQGGFVSRQKVRFAHCDPAGIAYYPRYFEIVDAAIEDWTAHCLGATRAHMHFQLGLGLPTVSLQAEFVAPSRLGDDLDIRLVVTDVGRSSVTLAAEITRSGRPRFIVFYKQVLMALDVGRSRIWLDAWRQRLEAAREKVPDA